MQGKTTSAEIIIEQNEFDDRILSSPNGRDSLLSPQLWRLVRTPEFIEWFESPDKSISEVC